MRFFSSIINGKNLTYFDKIDQLTEHDIFHKYDTFDKIYTDDLFSRFGFPGLFVSDHHVLYEDLPKNVEYLGLPLWLEKNRKLWTLDEFSNPKIETNYCFNFTVNKKQINRYLCIKLVEVFKLKSFIYTWSGVDTYFDCKEIIKEYNSLKSSVPLDQNQFGQLLSPIKTKVKFFNANTNSPAKKDMSTTGISNYGGVRGAWDSGCKNLFTQSAVSLITESVSHQKANVHTEKTMFSLLGLGFPIWVGGYKQAETWKKMGFDIFDDVINHDYQYYDTLLERCCYAFILNKKILSDIDFATSIRLKNFDRLVNNRELVLSGQLTSFVNETIAPYYTRERKNSFDELLKNFTIDSCQWKPL